jgi:hypothetical protein
MTERAATAPRALTLLERLPRTITRRLCLAVSAIALTAAAPDTAESQDQDPATAAATAHDDAPLLLRLATDAEGVRQLGLSAEAKKKIADLIARRAAERKTLLSAAGLSEDDRRQIGAAFSAATEQLGLQLLTLEQRDKLTQLLLGREGLVTLARDDVAKLVGLTPSQRAAIGRLEDERRQALAAGSPLAKQIATRRFERRFEALLTPKQLAGWEKLAGLDDDTTVAAAQPPDESGAPAEPPEGNAPPTPDKTAGNAASADPDEAVDSGAAVALDDIKLTFEFDGASWRTVLDWLAEEAKLSLYVGTEPTGTFTYSDPREFTPDQAIAYINRFLIPRGYTLIRSGTMISIIGLDDGRRDALLESLAEYVELNELDSRRDDEVVKCVFKIVKTQPQEALAEISRLVKLSTPVLLPKSKQLIVIERVKQLKMVRRMLEVIENPSTEDGPLRRFELQHVRANVILDAARPLIGIDDGNSNIGPDISLAPDPTGKHLLATGAADKLAIIESLIAMLDRTPEERGMASETILRVHAVGVGNLQMVDDVLQTLLAGEDVRLAQEPRSGRLVVQATEEVHERIAKTIEQLAGSDDTVFEVIRLKEVEPYIALSIVREMLDIPFFYDEEEEDDDDHPRLDYDTPSMKIFVRGTQKQVDAVKEIVAELETPNESSEGPLRLLPIQGTRAQQLLETAKRFWPGSEDVLVFPPAIDESSEVLEFEINGKPREDARPEPMGPRPAPTQLESTQRLIGGPLLVNTVQASRSGASAKKSTTQAAPPAGDEPPKPPGDDDAKQPPETKAGIKAQVTSRGILMQSEDAELLNRFEAHLRAIAGPGQISPTRIAIFYLKYVRADDAKRMLTDLRRGSPSDDDPYGPDEDDSLGPRRRTASPFPRSSLTPASIG